ncbi:MAG: hypothetical protein PHY21_08930 [Candidatus Cloacimonetes bacterium]|jgi:hypothetical protein|nr:hypothetical protein [Candidatus Cloacimonadota bacterium]
MENLGYMVSFIVSMMGVAFPLLLKMISELSDKYGTTQIIDRFKRELRYEFFVWSLISSILVCILWIMNLPPIKIGMIERIFSGSAERLLILSVIITIISFFLLVFRMLTYYDPIRISKSLLLCNGTRWNQTKSVKKIDESLKIVTSIITSYIRTGNEDIVNELIKLYSKAIGNSVSNADISSGDRIYYDLSRKIFNATLSRDDTVFEGLTKDILKNVWFPNQGIMDVANRNISYHTWCNLTEVIVRDRVSIFMDYWKDADERVRDYLFDHDLPAIVLSDSNVDKLMHYWIDELQSVASGTKPKDLSDMEGLPEYLEPHTNPNNNMLLLLLKFVCYHTNLGGLLLYLRKYEVIRRVFSYTSSLPPNYYLLPDTFTEVFRLFLMSHDRFDIFYSLTPMNYAFPDMEGINQDESTWGLTCHYIAILYIRLFTLVPMYSPSYHTNLPQLPNSKHMLNAWESSAEYLKLVTISLLGNKEVIQGIGFKRVVEENGTSIISKLEEFIDSIKKMISSNIKNYQPTPEQIAEYVEKITASLSKSIDDIMLIDNNQEVSANYTSWHIRGARRIIGKEDFQDHPCREDFVLTPLISEMHSKLYQSFYSQNATSYLVSMDDLFPAVSKLNADAKQFVLIGFNVYLGYHINTLKIKDLSENEFQGIKVHLYNVSSRPSSCSLFLVRKSDLPTIMSHGSEQAEIDKYRLKVSNTEYEIFTSLLDLNLEKEIAGELQPTLGDIEADRCMLACVDYHIEVRWKNDPQMIHLQVYNRNMKLGIPVDVKDVSSLE